MRGVVVLLLALLIGGCEKIEVYKKSADGRPVEFGPREVQCVKCTMQLESKEHSAQAIMPNGRVYFFDDPGCMALWIKDQKDAKRIKLWVYTDDTHRYIEAKKACYRLGVQTPMNYGFGAYEKRRDGCVGFDRFVAMMARGENMTNPAIKKRILERQ
ncbi:MAG: hypothetical protein C6H99_06110 [Epsilonproteobacteria bacterium]|nr:hypothetical protein [Campylobacterota bacterium]NPA65176.1 hypothetical protein [Campylobacterota bacterium]